MPKANTHSVNYKCRKHKEFHCGARLVYKDGVYRISGTHHTHPIEDDEIGRISFVNECCRRAGLQRAPGELKSIFEETRRDFPDVSIGYNAALEKRMYRAQQERKPPNPTSFDEAEELIREHPHYSKTLDGSSDFFKARVSTATGTALIFLSITLLTQLRTTKQIQADGTFKTVPNLFYQLFTLHFKAYKKSFPVAFVLMSEKSLDLYNAVMEKILDTLQEIDPDREEQIYAGFMAIQQENAADLQLESQEIQDAVQRLYVYWAGYWLVRQTPARFSVNGDKSRTNNEVEKWNRWFNARCHGHRQNFWAFIYQLQECEETARRDFLVASRGGEIRRPTPNRYIVRDEQILGRARDLSQNIITIYEFSMMSSVSFEPYDEGLPENVLEAPAPRRQRRLARLQGDGRQQVRTRAGALRRDQGEPEADAPRRPVGRPPRRDRGEPEADAPRRPVERPPRRDRGEPEADAPRRLVGRPPRRDRGEPEADAPRRPVGRPPRRDRGEPEADAPRRPVGRPPRRDRGEPVADAVALLCKLHKSSSTTIPLSSLPDPY
ncbi:hypothetical protein DAPPUDRAFT_326828 [Daphnia pulex]|uniref:MULE transposase domain-containing protein n=1 Tax=Daphnia pulex TaxID=6669 RepID=E9H8W6_DAPPU|nr:hypothetical protein DAPPUDRAFT_326828 [Daphnia pulex]|eukprot:EFX71793.1 hypothetical protein DAPPUDRAFT_326828 [Daphnia pulex]